MINGFPLWIDLFFIAVTIATITLFYFSNNRPRRLIWLIISWSIIQGAIGYTGFYQNTMDMPPRFALIVIPWISIIIYSIFIKQKNWIIENHNLNRSTFLHSIRIPVEVILHQLFLFQMVPELMTFEGRNFDIIIGLTAPLIAGLFMLNKCAKKVLLFWNVIGLGFILFILINAILSAEFPFQQFAFDQPNRAVLFFPYIYLPATIVPIVIWSHLASIKKLLHELS